MTEELEGRSQIWTSGVGWVLLDESELNRRWPQYQAENDYERAMLARAYKARSA